MLLTWPLQIRKHIQNCPSVANTIAEPKSTKPLKKLIWLWPVFFLVMKSGFAQDISVKGVVMEEMLDGKLMPLEFVNVVWLQSNRATTTDSTGYFFIAHGNNDGDQLIFQFL